MLHRKFAQTAKEFSSKLAIIDRTTGRKVTYERALIGALILSARFSKFEPGFTGIMLPTSAGCALAIYGTLMSSRTPVMINYSTGAEQNVKFAQARCDFKTVVTSRALLAKINCPELPGMVFLEDIMESLSAVEKVMAAMKAKLPLPLLYQAMHQGSLDDTAVILFTSGSEKDPKAVQLTHRNFLANIDGIQKVFDLTHEDRFFSCLPCFHVFGLTGGLWLPMSIGMTLVTYANPLDAKEICTVVREERPTMMIGTPSFYWSYLRRSEPGDFSSVRLMVTGADKCPTHLREEFLKKHGITLIEGYGATETSPVISANNHGANKPGSVGRALPGIEVLIENYETGEPCKPGETGKILVRGDSIMKGYFDDFEQTALHIRHGWYDTGDMGIIDEDGFLWHVGRLKRFVKVGGEMVSLVLVEEVLDKLIPDEVQCCVVELPDAIKGAKIVAAVTAEIDRDSIIKEMSKQLPNIALPKQFVTFDDLPKMGSGKIDFRKITEMVREKLKGA